MLNHIPLVPQDFYRKGFPEGGLDNSTKFIEYKWLCDHPGYLLATMRWKKRLMVDNSSFYASYLTDTEFEEHFLDSLKILSRCQAAYKISVLPDKLHDPKFTMESYARWVPYIRRRYPDVHVCLTVQGHDNESFMCCYEEALRYAPDMLAIPFKLVWECPVDVPGNAILSEHREMPNKRSLWIALNRVRMMLSLKKEGLLSQEVPHHLLGLEHLLELSYQKEFKWVVSNDSAFIYDCSFRTENVFGLLEEEFNKPKIALDPGMKWESVSKEVRGHLSNVRDLVFKTCGG